MGYPDHDKELSSLCQSNPHYATKLSSYPCVGQNNSTKSVSYKHPRKFCVSVLRTHVAFFWICVKAKWVASDEAIILRSGCSFGSATWLEHL